MRTQIFFIEQFFYQIVVCLTKISIVLLYLRIFPKDVSPRFTYVSYTIIFALAAYALVFIMYFALCCQPASYFWNQWDGEHEGTCDDFQRVAYINSGLNIFFDLVVFFLPIPKLLRLKVRDKRRKVGAILTFLVGLFVTACSVVRLINLAQTHEYTNATYHYNTVAIWTGLEAATGVICACMPAIVGPIIYLFCNKIGSRFTSMSASRSRGTIDDPVKRTYRVTFDSDEVELGDTRDSARDSKGSGAETTNVTPTFGLPGGDQGSGDDTDVIYLDTLHGGKPGQHQYDV